MKTLQKLIILFVFHLCNAQPNINDKVLYSNIPSNVEVITSGEVAHQAKEFISEKTKLIEELNMDYNFNHIAFEENPFFCFGYNLFIHSQITEEELLNGFFKTNIFKHHRRLTFLNFLRELKKINEDRPTNQKIHIISLDLQQPHFTINGLNTLFAQNNINIPAEVLHFFRFLPLRSADNKLVKLSNQWIEDMKLDTNKYDKMNRYFITDALSSLENSIKLYLEYPNEEYDQARDYLMAERALTWSIKFNNLIILAHNGHINNQINLKDASRGYHFKRELAQNEILKGNNRNVIVNVNASDLYDLETEVYCVGLDNKKPNKKNQ